MVSTRVALGQERYTCGYLLGASRGTAEVSPLGTMMLAGGMVWRACRVPVAPALRVAVLLAATTSIGAAFGRDF